MDSVTRGSGIALSVLIAVMASILLLVPGKPAGSWRGPGTPGQPSCPPMRRRQPGAWSDLDGSPPPAVRPARPAGRTTLRVPRHGPAKRPGPGRPGAGRSGPAWIMPSAGAHRNQHASRRLSRYLGIRPDLP